VDFSGLKSSGGLRRLLTEEVGKRNEVDKTDVNQGIDISIAKLSASVEMVIINCVV
jgi:hypothetical protein